MPSYLHFYPDGATDREAKFIRAVQSFLDQTYWDKELVIVSDGCDVTERILNSHFANCDQIVLIKVAKHPHFSGAIRQIGLDHANGEIIAYLDTDDKLGQLHLSTIESVIKQDGLDWIYFNDMLYYGEKEQPILRECNLTSGGCGVSTIAHRKDLKNVFWTDCNGYGHDWAFVEKLIRSSANNKKCYGMSYYVCHRKGFKHDH